jgi:DNA-binding CsgD family transcriptional regulator
MPADRSAIASTLLERDRELLALGSAIDAGVGSAGGVVVLEGDAGAGKTTLLAWSREYADERGARVLSARGGVLERTFAFGVARQLFEDPLASAADSEREALLAGSAALAAPLLHTPAPAGAPAVAGIDQLQARHGLYWLVANLAEQRPLVLVVDDAHWCDDASLDWLLYLARRIEELPIVLILAVRLGEATDTPAELLAAIAGEPVGKAIAIAPLSVGGTTELLQTRYARPVEPDFAAACHARTGGNPHFVSELAAELIAEGIEPVADSVELIEGILPERISEVTLMRIARLPDNAAALSRALAILGTSATVSPLAALAGLQEQEAFQAAEELIAARILDPGPPLRFIHPLIDAVVYDDLSPVRRAADHKRAALLLREDSADAEQIASQLIRADAAGEAWVVECLRAAAEEAIGRGAASSAVTLLRRARGEPPQDDVMASVQLELGIAEAFAGDPAGFASLQAALAASTTPVERAHVALLLGRFWLIAGRAEAAADVLAAAIAQLDRSEHELLLQLEAAFINAAHGNAALRERARSHLAAVRGAVEEDSHAGRLIAVVAAYAATAAGDPVDEAVGLARTALCGDLLLREVPLSPDIYLVPMSMLALCDELDEADTRYSEAISQARATGSELAYAASACLHSWTCFLLGRLADAELLARDALRIAGGSPTLGALVDFASGHLACTLLERGETPVALAILGDRPAALIDAPDSLAPVVLFAAGRALLAEQRPAEALEALLACGESSRAAGVENPAFLPWRSQSALAAHNLGDTAQAEELCTEEVLLARGFGARRPLGIALRAQGLVTGGGAGLELLEESVEILRESPARLERAHSLVAYGAALRRANRRAVARELLADGLELATVCGAVPLAAHALTELSASGARPRAHGRWDTDALTASELRVCEMAAAGMSNPEIAQALFVTRGTVESHLHVAYRKLKISSRQSLPEALAAHRPATGVEAAS